MDELTDYFEKDVEEGIAVNVRDASFSWKKDQEEPTLSHLTFQVLEGGLVGIVGRVGSGKSSLLLALCGEMKKTDGRIIVGGKLGLVTQVPWIINGSIRENITLAVHEEDGFFDEERYRAIVQACCLDEDIKEFPGGDLTEIGERGVNLSGGQKARLALARACYANLSIYLFDDPLAAVDPAVAGKIYKRVIGPKGVLSKKTRILVTHNTDVLKDADEILVLEAGRITTRGSFASLESNAHFAGVSVGKASSTMASVDHSAPIESLIHDSNTRLQDLNKNITGKLTAAEDRKTGSVTRSIYAGYISAAGGIPGLLVVIFAFSIAQAARQLSDWWLARWSTDAFNRISGRNSFSNGNAFYVYVFLGFALVTIFLSVTRIALFMYFTLVGSRNLHDRMLVQIVHATQAYFDTNPMGRILNRFSRDVDQVDFLLPITAVDFVQATFIALGALITIAAIFPWFLLPMMPITVAFLYLQRIYTSSARELKRWESVTRSPIYSQFSETFAGLETIRAFGLQGKMSRLFTQKIDSNHESYFLFINAARWLGIRLDGLATLVIVVTATLVLCLQGKINEGLAGVALTQSLLMTGIFQWGVRQAAETENLFTSVERILTQTEEAPIEEDAEDAESVDENWPNAGVVEFRNVVMRYRPELPPALKNMCFKTTALEKLGIIGRTGAGKSSVTAALFRMASCEQGTISIDGVDIAKVKLRDLRQRLSIVPQEPVLFQGTIRSNLDCLEKHRDDALWDVLKSVQLDTSGCLPDGLETYVSERGANFSVGERQLLCLGRALLEKTRIVLLDEATAAVDNVTDRLMQRAIRDQFAQCTVITIAHRQNTIADCDRVMIVADGNCSKIDIPKVALEFFNSRQDASRG